MNAIVAIITGCILSLTAIFRPDIAIRWIFSTAVLCVGFIDYFFPQLNFISWGVGFSGILLLVIASMHFLSKSHMALDRISLSFILFAIFLFIPILSNFNNPLQFIAFGKNIIQYWGFVPLAALGFLHHQSRNKIIKIITFTIFIQAIVSIYQAVFIVDWANRIAGGDSVVGTFGGTPDGGGSSGAQTIYLTVIISCMLTIYISNHIRIIYLIPLLFVSLIPISLNETKVFFILMFITLLYLFFTGFVRFPARTLQVTLIGAGIVLTIFTVYFIYLQHSYSGQNVDTVSEYTERMTKSNSGFYIGEGRDASNSRLGSIKFWWSEQVRRNNFLELLVGHGLGASKFGGVFPGKLTDVKSPYYGLKLDRTGLSSLLWDTGIVGTILFFYIFISAWSLARKTRSRIDRTSYEKSIIWGIECGIIILALGNIYDSYFFTNPGLNAFTMLIFAYAVGTLKSSYPNTIDNSPADISFQNNTPTP